MADDDLIVRAYLRDELSAGLRGIQGELAKTRAAAAGLGLDAVAGSKAVDDLGGASKRSTATLAGLDTSLRSASATVGGLFVSGLTKGATAVGLLGTVVAGFGLKAASGFQQSKLAFDTLLGSVDKGNALFAQLQQINLTTPFQLKEIAPATQLLLRYGVAADSVVPVLKSLLDAAALSGDPAANLQQLALATGQVVSSGRLLGQDARQLQQGGVNAYAAVAAQMGITTAAAVKLGQAGKISADQFIQALTSYSGPLGILKGGAEAQAHTLSGQLSNFLDAINIGLAGSAGPLVDKLTTLVQPITKVVGEAVSQIGPPIFDLVGLLVDGLSKTLPVVAPLLGTIVTGLGDLLTAAGPALGALGPLGGTLGQSITDMFTALVPVMPDVVGLFVAMVGVLPDFVKLLTALIPIIDPMVRLITSMLGFEPVRGIVAGLLVALLGYRAVSNVVGGLRSFAEAMHLIGVESRFAASAPSLPSGVPGGGGGPLRTAAKAAGWATVTGLALADANAAKNIITGVLDNGVHLSNPFAKHKGDKSNLEELQSLFGGGFGDPVVPPWVGSRHAAAAGSNSMLQITSGQRNWGVRSSDSGHVRGTAVDVAGPGLNAYAQRVRDQGGWAVLEGHGSSLHAHADFGDPAIGTGGGSGGSIAGASVSYNAFFSGPINGIADLQGAVLQLFRDFQRQDRERAYAPLMT